MSWWETLHLVTWWKRLGISAIKTGQDAPSWIWCTERLSFFGGGHIVLQRFVHVRCHFQPLPTKLVFAYFDRGSYESELQSFTLPIPESKPPTHNLLNHNHLISTKSKEPVTPLGTGPSSPEFLGFVGGYMTSVNPKKHGFCWGLEN